MAVASAPIGALDLYRQRGGPLDDPRLTGALWAAGLAALPLLDLMNRDLDSQGVGAEALQQLATLERVEVYQATGMIVGALDIGPADAVAMLRAHAVSHDLTASEVAYRVLDRRILLAESELRPADGEDRR